MKNKNKSLGLEADSRSHQTDEYWIRHFFNEQYKSLPEHLGFTASRATFLADLLLQSSLSDHQTVLYWAKVLQAHVYEDCLKNGDNLKMKTNRKIKMNPKMRTTLKSSF